MDPSRVSRFLDPTSAVAAITKHKAEAMKLAREQSVAVQEMCRRAKTECPPYEFEELIGKGSYGRVYKGHQLPSRKVVAIKVLDIDSMDYQSVRDFRDESIKDFIRETKVMTQVKDSGAKNINALIEAISIHSQLWLVCEYCPGGSVRTLMRATGDRLEDKYIITIARELAAGLRAIHDAGIIHRDIKAANILIHEEGRLEICDFGVAGVLQSQTDKRSTWIGTPHWMPPEMFATRGEAHQYGSEIDVWAYGCTLFEFATGNPPNSNLRERMQIGRQLTRNTPKLDNAKYSDGLKSLVSFALESNPISRPSMADVMAHSYIADTEEAYPTSSLSELVRNYYQWSQRGGQRISLFHPGGAAAAEAPGTQTNYEEDWNFSTTDGFERRFSVIDLDQLAASLAEMEDQISPTAQTGPENELTDDSSDKELTTEDKANFDERVRRGAEAMEGLFNEDLPSYKYETKNDFVPIEPKPAVSDLPLRTDTDRSSVTSTFIDIDIGSFDSSHYAAGATSAQPFQLADADTIRANRTSGRQHQNSIEGRSRSSSSGVSSTQDPEEFQPPSGPRPPTMDWKFPVFMQAPGEAEAEPASSPEPEIAPETKPAEPETSDKRATMEWTFPVMTAPADDEATGSVDLGRYDTLKAPIVDLQPPATVRYSRIGEPGDSRPSTSRSESNASVSSENDYDPFRFDRPSSPQGGPLQGPGEDSEEYPQLIDSIESNEYEPSVMDGPGPDEEEEHEPREIWPKAPAVLDRSPSHSEPFPTAIPTKELGPSPPFVPPATASMSDSLPTARNKFPVLTATEGEPILFPELTMPQLDTFAAGAGEHAMAGELDRLLGSFIDSLNATNEALSRVSIGPDTKADMSSTPEHSE
ncbi:kinase-like protein [Aspergillus ellipticus CBS 707.79]|uniref:non-specific serine/threonine protein kinase n=1 Tax=Aspergillus ellipticus CBS 707.79 TaxID=1448320 RepID=A0A319E115_9EURO|nr:kinase-like protein [Aspergillus ellipticus CBS 707.79]